MQNFNVGLGGLNAHPGELHSELKAFLRRGGDQGGPTMFQTSEPPKSNFTY